jgi:hypothetical protein
VVQLCGVLSSRDVSAYGLDQLSEEPLDDCLIDYYRCPERFAHVAVRQDRVSRAGYFQFGEDATCYGAYTCNGRHPSSSPDDVNFDALGDALLDSSAVRLPFAPGEVVRNLREEVYAEESLRGPFRILGSLYYWLRPIMPVHVRRHLQRFYLRDWERVPFPRWPVDCSVDSLHEKLMLLSLNASGALRIPFIWFWPNNYSGCAIMTHDIETRTGRNYCTTLMDLDDEFGIKASFQVIPEGRYAVSREFLQGIRDRQFEIVVHDLNHDGLLYKNYRQFLERAARINAYGREFGAKGFRAAVLYRKQQWFDAFDFAYDMSVPNVARLDPQRGGCCTVMPYFVGKILEIPVTTLQDYTLFNILNDYSIDLWKRQLEIILGKHGLASFIVHPDYVNGPRELSLYKALLAHLAELKREQGIWITTPGEVNQWWRQRQELRLVGTGEDWRIEGEGKERARIAYASEKNGRLVFSMAGDEDQTTLCGQGVPAKANLRWQSSLAQCAER